MINLKRLQELDSSESSTGVITKWYDEANQKYIKASAYNRKKGTYHVEAVMECLASDIAALLGVPVVKYSLDKGLLDNNKSILVCVSDDYRHQLDLQDVISARTILLQTGLDLKDWTARYPTLLELFPHLRLSLDQMIVYDYLIDNYDRHLRNFEFCRLRDGSVRLAPMFDNGSSLLSNFETEEDLSDLRDDDDFFEEIIQNAETQSKCFRKQHNTELHLVDKTVFDTLNMQIAQEQFDETVMQYSDYLSPLRVGLIKDLLRYRYRKLLAFASSN